MTTNLIKARNAARPKVRNQIHPEALAIMDRYQVIPQGFDDYGMPHYRGITEDTWNQISKNPKDFTRLLSILERDYPTFAALCQKIWAKKFGHLMPFVFNKTQMLMWDAIARRLNDGEPLFFAVLKARQLGISTLVNGWIHWQTWRVDDIESLMVTHDRPLAGSFVDRLRIFHEELPKVPGIMRSLRTQAKNARVPKDELYYNETRSKVSTVIAKSAETRGRSTLHNHLAELAFYPAASELLGSLMPQLPAAGSPARLQCSVIVESTPCGKNDFYDLCKLAQDPDSEWEMKFFPWYVADDEYYMVPPHGWKMDEEQRAWAENLGHLRKEIDGVDHITPGQVYWYEQTYLTEEQGNQDKMDAEYPSDMETCFLMRSRSIFTHEMRYLNATVIEAGRRAPAEFKKRGMLCEGNFLRGRLEYNPPPSPFGNSMMTLEQIKLKPTFVTDPNGPICLWEPPMPDHLYVAGIDAAAGLDESDNSVICLLDVTTGRQVGEYCGQIAPEKLADDAVALGWWFNGAVLYPEINSIGVVTMKRIRQLWHYPWLGREERWDEVALKANKYGHFTNHDNKVIMVSFVVDVIRHKYLAIASDALLSELSTFVKRVSRDGFETFEADANNADDRVMALCLACYAVRQSPKMYASLTKNQHKLEVPSALDSGIFDAPTPTENSRLDRVPEEVRRALEGAEVLACPSNPIRGHDILGVAI